MDYLSYHRQFFADPPPPPRFAFSHTHTTLFYADYAAAVDYYTRVLGPPFYVEGEGTRGWLLGASWLTLLRGRAGNPRNVEVTITMETPEAAEALQAALIAAGGQGPDPSDQLMYVPVRTCPVTDPFGTDLLVVAPLDPVLE